MPNAVLLTTMIPLLNITIDQISENVAFSRTSTVELQKQFDDYKEKNRKESSEMQRQIKDKLLELERCYQTIKRLQDEVICTVTKDKRKV